MIHLFKTCMITAFILGLTWSAPLRAQDQRYISIRNTDTIWLPGNICAYQFRLDNGGNGEGFGPLTITLQLKDKYGQTLVTRKMETDAFGDSNATRTTDAFLETECVENVATTEIIKATEESNGHRVSLPLSVFDPQDYHPLLITVSGKNVNRSLKSVSCFSLCHNAWQRLFIYQEKTDMRKRAARTVLTGMCYSVGSATRQGSSSPTRFIGQSAMTSRT